MRKRKTVLVIFFLLIVIVYAVLRTEEESAQRASNGTVCDIKGWGYSGTGLRCARRGRYRKITGKLRRGYIFEQFQRNKDLYYNDKDI